jgi:hypothetical protein
VWLADNILALRKVSTPQQTDILASVHSFWFNHRTAPSFKILQDTLERKNSNPGVMEELSQYEHEEDLTIYSIKDLGQLLTDMVDEWQSRRLSSVLKVVKTINGDSWKDPKTKRVYSGAKDAAKYLIEAVESGLVFTGQRAAMGALNETAHELMDLYEKYKADSRAGNLRVRTGIPQIDSIVTIKRGDFVGVLGYAGQRKSTLSRTIAYNAVMAGFNVLHVTLEQTYDEERTIYALIHSEHPKFGRKYKLSKKRFEEGQFTPEEEVFFREVLQDFEENSPGRLIIRQPTDGSSWPTIKMMAEVVNQTTPIDLFLIDYLTICATSSRNSKEEHENNIKDAKQFALQMGDGRGCVVLTPVQGNRKGWEAAIEAGGHWDMTGVYEYSEFDKSVDLMLTVLIDKEVFGDEDLIGIGSAKSRRSKEIEVFTAPVIHDVGYIAVQTVHDQTVNPGTSKRPIEDI